MKPSLERDFSISVRHQIWEELPEKAEFYRGIYSVTFPSVNEDMEDSDIDLKRGVVFFVNPQEFDVFSKKLSELANQTSGVHDYVKISEIKELELAKFILSNIISSQHFSARELKILRIEDKYTQTK